MERRHRPLRPAVVVCTGIVLLSACATPAASTSSTPATTEPVSPDAAQGTIAFALALADGGAELHAVSATGGDDTRLPLPELLEDYGRAFWSHDGSRMLLSPVLRFDDEGEVLPFRGAIVAADGTGFVLLDAADLPFDVDCSAWTRDDQAVYCSIGDPAVIERVSVTDPRTREDVDAAPVGVREFVVGESTAGAVALLRIRPDAGGEAADLFLLDPGAKEPRQLTRDGVLMPHEAASAMWSPDGTTLISSTRDGDIVLIDAVSGELTPVSTGLHGFAFAPSFSPDGGWISFGIDPDGGRGIFSPTGSVRLYVAHADGSGAFAITAPGATARFPVWRPAG